MILYEAYNKKNGKVYVGLTINSLEYRKSQHLRSAKAGSSMHFHKALRKHGPESFEWCVVMVCPDLKTLQNKEMLLISLHEPWQLYNKSLGGEHSAYGMKHSDDTKEVCRQHALRRWDGVRAADKYPDWIFKLCSYRAAKKFGIPKTTWYRQRRSMGVDLT